MEMCMFLKLLESNNCLLQYYLFHYLGYCCDLRGLVLYYTTVAVDSFTQSRLAYRVSNNWAICPQCLQVLYSCTSYSFRIMKWYLLPQTGCLLQPIKLSDKRQWYWDSPAITVTIAFDRICLFIDICRRKNVHTNSGELSEAGRACVCEVTAPKFIYSRGPYEVDSQENSHLYDQETENRTA